MKAQAWNWSPLAKALCQAVERSIPGQGPIRKAAKRAAVPAMIALGEAFAVLALYLPAQGREQDAVGRVLDAIEREVSRTPAGRRWVQE